MNRSLQAKSSARLAAVQLLYQAAVAGTMTPPEVLAAEYLAFFEENQENAKEMQLPQVAPDAGYLRKLLTGVAEHRTRLEPLVERVLNDDWKKDRISPLLLAILRVAAFELAEGKVKQAIVTDEYASLAARFFTEAETGFVHAALHTLAKELHS